MNKFLMGVAAVAVLAAIAVRTNAQVTLTSGAGSAVTSVDRIATFDTVITGTNLAAYTEGNLIIRVAQTAFIGFDPANGAGGFSGGFHYPSGGITNATDILAADGADIKAIEFNIGTGFTGNYPPDFHYFIYNNGVLLGDSFFTAPVGSVVGFKANVTIDEIRLGAYADAATALTATPTTYQALAIDNLKVQINGQVVPEPGTYATLAGIGVTGLGLLLRRRRA